MKAIVEMRQTISDVVVKNLSHTDRVVVLQMNIDFYFLGIRLFRLSKITNVD
ncbi:MAG: hypothetical protein U0M63_01015 [Alistipes onderdonkii]|jgi:hypothetical protein|nr:hypothetical protein [Alistipes onderdonkii]MEE0848233.1 hypothetical protein [Alistipes onderdonkii]